MNTQKPSLGYSECTCAPFSMHNIYNKFGMITSVDQNPSYSVISALSHIEASTYYSFLLGKITKAFKSGFMGWIDLLTVAPVFYMCSKMLSTYWYQVIYWVSRDSFHVSFLYLSAKEIIEKVASISVCSGCNELLKYIHISSRIYIQ